MGCDQEVSRRQRIRLRTVRRVKTIAPVVRGLQQDNVPERRRLLLAEMSKSNVGFE